MTKNRNAIADTLANYDNFLVTAHENPDGDALGSMAGVGFLLQTLNKNFRLYNKSGVPQKFDWLQLPSEVFTELPNQNPEWLIVLDSGDSTRPGEPLASLIPGTKTINIDHHLGNPDFGDLNWVEPARSSVGEMIALLLQEMHFPSLGPLAEALYLAMASDTGFFTYDNTTPEVLEITAGMIREGLDIAKINHLIQSRWTLGKLHLHGKILKRAELHCAGQVGLIHITGEDFRKTGTDIEDCEGLVNYVRNISGVEIAVSIREEGPGECKFSLRSQGEMDVQEIASSLGGGGHKNASGGKLYLEIEKARKTVLQEIAACLPDCSTERD